MEDLAKRQLGIQKETHRELEGVRKSFSQRQKERREGRKNRRAQRQEGRQERRDARQERKEDRRDAKQEGRDAIRDARVDTNNDQRLARIQARNDRRLARIQKRGNRLEYGRGPSGERLSKKEQQQVFEAHLNALANPGTATIYQPASSPKSTANYASTGYNFDSPSPSRPNTEASQTPPISTSNPDQKNREQSETLDDVLPKANQMKQSSARRIEDANVSELRFLVPLVLDDYNREDLKDPDKLLEMKDEVRASLLKQDFSPDQLETIYRELKRNDERRRDHADRMVKIQNRLNSLTEDQVRKVARMLSPSDAKAIDKTSLDALVKRMSQLSENAAYFDFKRGEEALKFIENAEKENAEHPKSDDQEDLKTPPSDEKELKIAQAKNTSSKKKASEKTPSPTSPEPADDLNLEEIDLSVIYGAEAAGAQPDEEKGEIEPEEGDENLSPEQRRIQELPELPVTYGANGPEH